MKKRVLEVYREALQRAEKLRTSELSGDGYLELMWVCAELEKTAEVNPPKQ
ncbi:MAG: hypothetical protein AAB877_02875 [Patescibacteria group bacterium]